MTRFGSLALLSARLGGSGRMWRPMILPAVVAMLFTAFYAILCGFALSGEQTAARDLGSADHRMSISVSPGDRITTVTAQKDLFAELEDVGVTESWVSVQSFDVRPDSIPRPLTTGKSRTVSYVEGEQLGALFPGSRRLIDGGWPSRPGEVAITPALRDRLQSSGDFDGEQFAVFSGLVNLHVTGIYNDRFAEAAYGILAAPGTWASFPSDAIDDRFTGTSALASVYWAGGGTTHDVANVLARVAPTQVHADTLLTGVVDRADREKSDNLSLVDSASFVFTLPFVALTAAALAMSSRAVLAWAGGVVDVLVGVGLRRRPLAASVVLASVGISAVASLAGSLVGVGVGEVVRRSVLPKVVEQPVGPIRDLSPILVVGVTASLVVVPVAFAGIFGRPSRRSRLWAIATSVPWSLLRWLTIAVLLVRAMATVGQGTDIESAAQVIAQLVAATLLAVPDIIRLAVATLPTATIRELLVKRLMQADRARFAIMGVLVALSIAAPTAASTYVATSTRTEAAGNLSQVPPGQLWIDLSEGKPAVRAGRIVAAELGSPPLSLGATNAFTEGDLESRGPVQIGIKSIASTDDLEDLLGFALSAQDRGVLESGGALLTSGVADGRSVQVQSGTDVPRDLPIQVELVEDVSDEVQRMSAGFILTETANDLHLKITPSLSAFGGLSTQEIRNAVEKVRLAGHDTHSLQYHVVPEPTEPTREWYTALVGLLSVAALILGALMASHASRLREYSVRLVALGLGRRWAARVGILEFGVVALTAGLAAFASSVASIAILTTTTRETMILDIPWRFILSGVVATLALCVVVLALALRPRMDAGRA